MSIARFPMKAFKGKRAINIDDRYNTILDIYKFSFILQIKVLSRCYMLY